MHDGLLILLGLYHTGSNYSILSGGLRLSNNLVRAAANRVRAYTLDRGLRQIDTENMIILTNHHIRQFELCAEDDDHYQKWLTHITTKAENKKRRTAEATKSWRRKLARMTAQSSDPRINNSDEALELREASFWNARVVQSCRSIRTDTV